MLSCGNANARPPTASATMTLLEHTQPSHGRPRHHGVADELPHHRRLRAHTPTAWATSVALATSGAVNGALGRSRRRRQTGARPDAAEGQPPRRRQIQPEHHRIRRRDGLGSHDCTRPPATRAESSRRKYCREASSAAATRSSHRRPDLAAEHADPSTPTQETAAPATAGQASMSTRSTNRRGRGRGRKEKDTRPPPSLPFTGTTVSSCRLEGIFFEGNLFVIYGQFGI